MKTVSLNAFSPRGALTDTTHTPTSARPAVAKVINSGWVSIVRVPDHANAKVILLISAHLESGHYFNPHAQRVIDGKANGAKLIVFDTRLSNTATHADYWVSPYPGSEAAILLAIANYLIQNNLYDREFVETLVELERVS